MAIIDCKYKQGSICKHLQKSTPKYLSKEFSGQLSNLDTNTSFSSGDTPFSDKYDLLG